MKASKTAKVRAWTSREKRTWERSEKKAKVVRSYGERVEHILVFDTETTTDKNQQLNFASAMYLAVGEDKKFHSVEELLIYADDLPNRYPEGYSTLQEYVKRGHSVRRGEFSTPAHMTRIDMQEDGLLDNLSEDEITSKLMKSYLRYPPNDFASRVRVYQDARHFIERELVPDIHLISQSEFNKYLGESAFPWEHWAGNKPATVVAMNMPFDLSRIALGVQRATGHFSGGFTFISGLDDKGDPKHSMNIHAAKRGIKGGIYDYTGDAKGGRKAYFTDIGTLAFGLTNESYSLARAAKTFGVEHRKMEIEQHGEITLDYIHYCRRDVLATTEVYIALVELLDRHPIELSDSGVFSPASIAKAYLSEMGVPEPLHQNKSFSDTILGHCMATFYGGRAEAHIRKVATPVEHVDVTSMYPTVNACMELWELLTCKRVDVREETEQVIELVDSLDIDKLFDPSTWPEFRGIVKVLPDDDLFPVRTAFNGKSETIGVSYITTSIPMWYSLPDVINAKINGGKAPKIIEAYRFYPKGGKLRSLRPVKLGGDIPIDPSTDDFFRHVIEQKQIAGTQHDPEYQKDGAQCACSGCRNKEALKVLANAGGYGIFVEMNRLEDKEESKETIYGNSDDPWGMKVYKPERPGQYCFPPVGALITGAARLLLGMLEKLVTDAGGTWVMCDTDSMAIAASKEGGWIAPEPCLPPRSVSSDYPEAIPLLAYEVVENIRKRFDSLSPYDSEVAGPITILKKEWPLSFCDDQIYCYAISAKRYTMFNISSAGDVVIAVDDKGKAANKEHGLGQYLNPEDPEKKDEKGSRGWVREIWRYMILSDAGVEVEEPYWFDRTVMSRVSVSTWNMYRNLERWNEGKAYADQIKPHGFLISPVVANPSLHGDMRLIGGFSIDATEWGDMDFIDIRNPSSLDYKISTDLTDLLDASRSYPVIGVKSYRDVVTNYSIHPEEKFTDSKGNVCGRMTRGVLHRHHLHIGAILHQGKETNDLEKNREVGVIPLGDVPNTEYWTNEEGFHEIVVPVLKSFKQTNLLAMVSAKGLSITQANLSRALNGKSRTHSQMMSALIAIAVNKAIEDFGTDLPDPRFKSLDYAYKSWRDVCSTWIRANEG